jgi:hypothetical protein
MADVIRGASRDGRESGRRAPVNQVPTPPLFAYSFTRRSALSSNGTEAAPAAIWRAFQGNKVVNAVARKQIFCICGQ